ncbi:MAG TPA: DUF4352 domain-containing protein [Candidatus Binatia bacterium]|nr:DUF4352 domain-containing protein [Candidatus Binatia bacterium]
MSDIETIPVTEKTNPRPSYRREEKHTAKIFLCILLILVLLAGGLYGTYSWQHQKTVSTNSTLSNLKKTLNSQIKTLNSQIISLKSSNKLLTSELKTATTQPAAVDQTDLTITVDSAARFNLSNGYSSANNGVAIELTITNPTTSSIDLTRSNFELQDNQDNVYEIADSVITSTLPSGYVPLADQTFTPAGTVKGAIFFEVDDLTLSNFNLINGSKTYTVVAN